MNTNKINRYDMYKYLNIFLYWKFIHFSGLMVSIYNILLHHFKIKNSKKIKKNNEKFNANFLQVQNFVQISKVSLLPPCPTHLKSKPRN